MQESNDKPRHRFVITYDITRDITLLTKVYIVKAMIFPVVMYSGES